MLETKIIVAEELKVGMTLQFHGEAVSVERLTFKPRVRPKEVIVTTLSGRREIPFDSDEEVEVRSRNGSAELIVAEPVLHW